MELKLKFRKNNFTKTISIFLTSSIPTLTYAECPDYSAISGYYLNTAEECTVTDLSNSYKSTNNWAFKTENPNAVINIDSANKNIVHIENNPNISSGGTVWAMAGTINIFYGADIVNESTSSYASVVAAHNNGIINLASKDIDSTTITTITQKGNSVGGAGIVAEKNRTSAAGKITAKGILDITTEGAPSIVATEGGTIELHNVTTNTKFNNNPNNNAILANASSVSYASGKFISSGIGLRAENGGIITSTASEKDASFMQYLSTNVQDATEIETSRADAHALYATGNNSKILLAGGLITETKGNNTSSLYATNSGNIQIQGPSTLRSSGNNGTAINNSNSAVITLLGNVTSTGDTTAIDNNNATINFFGSTSTFSGNAINNNATISLANGVLGGRLKIGGTYTGNNGLLILDTDLADDNSPTDFVEISGEVFGTTKVDIKSGNSQGAPTKNGIHIIQALAENQTRSSKEGVFVLAGTKGYITAGGIYDYYLEYRKNDEDGRNGGVYDNWYLMNYDYKEEDNIYTPDIGEYLATETMGNTLFTSRLEDREGASQYQGLGSKDVGNVWVRAYGGHNQFKTMNSQLKTTGNSFVTQMGTALVTLGDEDQYNLGAMTGFAYYDGKTRSSLTDRESKTKIDGYSLGFYGTWYAHPVEQRGTYIDSWVLWNKFNNSIDTPDYNKYKFNSSGVTASLEVGGDYLINKNGKKNWWVQPQSQIIYQGVHAENFQDAQGIDINHGQDNLQARFGVKTYLNIPTDSSKLTSYRPYVALNFIHNTNPYSVEINDIRYENEGSANLGELKLGVEGQVTKNSQVWLNASYVAGSHSNQAYQGNIGWKYNF